MTAAVPAIPFEAQSDPQGPRNCGAVCLRMIYTSFRKDVPLAEIWPAVSRDNQWGRSSMTHMMVRDAITRGFAAVAFQARHPLLALRRCIEVGAHVILNHRVEKNSPAGHYTVLVGLDDRDVIVHDPLNGPMRRIPHAEMLELWQPGFPGGEILGNLLIAIAAPPATPEAAAPVPCWLCHTPGVTAVACPRCHKEVGLQPVGALACFAPSCIARLWNSICCPACDCVFTFSLAQTGGTSSRVLQEPSERVASAGPAPGPPPLPGPKQPVPLDILFAQLDKFVAFAQNSPGAAENAELQKHLQDLAAQREKLKLIEAEAIANRAAGSANMAKLEQIARDNQEALAKRKESFPGAFAPLDGDVLGRALMRTLGFIR
jgi:hypothetical protein